MTVPGRRLQVVFCVQCELGRSQVTHLLAILICSEPESIIPQGFIIPRISMNVFQALSQQVCSGLSPPMTSSESLKVQKVFFRILVDANRSISERDTTFQSFPWKRGIASESVRIGL